MRIWLDFIYMQYTKNFTQQLFQLSDWAVWKGETNTENSSQLCVLEQLTSHYLWAISRIVLKAEIAIYTYKCN